MLSFALPFQCLLFQSMADFNFWARVARGAVVFRLWSAKAVPWVLEVALKCLPLSPHPSGLRVALDMSLDLSLVRPPVALRPSVARTPPPLLPVNRGVAGPTGRPTHVLTPTTWAPLFMTPPAPAIGGPEQHKLHSGPQVFLPFRRAWPGQATRLGRANMPLRFQALPINRLGI